MRSETARAELPRPARRARGRGRLAGATILLLDDDEDALAMLTATLESEGATIRAADRVRDALVLMHSCAPDVIVSDLVLPNVDGFSFVRAVRRDAVLQRTPAIAVTGHPEHGASLAAKDAGFDRVFVKPIDVESLIDEIARMVALRRRGGGS